jgi:hypothetical protein
LGCQNLPVKFHSVWQIRVFNDAIRKRLGYRFRVNGCRRDWQNIPLTKAVFEQVAQHQPQTIIAKLYTQAYAPFFGSGPPPFPLFIWDTNALAYFVHPEFATDTRGKWIDMHNTFDADYGKSIPYTSDPFPTIGLLQESTVIFAINTTAFYAFYVDLLTRPVPVKLVHPPPKDELDD